MPLLGSDTADMGYSDLSFALNNAFKRVAAFYREYSCPLPHSVCGVGHRPTTGSGKGGRPSGIFITMLHDFDRNGVWGFTVHRSQ
jgi:hypothetical protein